MMNSGIVIGRIELVDEFTMDAVNRAKGTSYDLRPTLFLEFHGSDAAVQADLAIAREVCNDSGCVDFIFETEARNQLWDARHDAALAVIQTAPQKKMKVTDVCVPLSELSQAIRAARAVIDARGRRSEPADCPLRTRTRGDMHERTRGGSWQDCLSRGGTRRHTAIYESDEKTV